LGEKEEYVVNLNSIIDQLKDKLDFDRDLSKLKERQMNLADKADDVN